MKSWSRMAGTTLMAGALVMPALQRAPAKKGAVQKPPVSAVRPMANDRTGATARPVDVLTVTGPEASRLVPL